MVAMVVQQHALRTACISCQQQLASWDCDVMHLCCKLKKGQEHSLIAAASAASAVRLSIARLLAVGKSGCVGWCGARDQVVHLREAVF